MIFWSVAPLRQSDQHSSQARLLLHALARQAGITAEMKIRFTPKPVIVQPVSWYCSVTHSGRWVGAALSPTPVGIDLERRRPHSLLLAKRICSSSELTVLDSSLSHDDAITAVWVLKEACLKADPERHEIMDYELIKQKGKIYWLQSPHHLWRGQLLLTNYYCGGLVTSFSSNHLPSGS